MLIRIALITFYILIITSCSSSPKQLDKKTSIDPSNNIFEFDQISDFKSMVNQKIFDGAFIVALPDYKRFSEFNNFFQIGMIYAIKEQNIENDIEFIFQEEINSSKIKNNFLIGPVSKDLVKNIDGSIPKNRVLFLNEANMNFYIALNNNSQINTLNKYLESKELNRIGIISDSTSDKNSERIFKNSWFNGSRDVITIESDQSTSSDLRIKNFLDVSESIERFEKINKASFSPIEFVPRTRDDIEQIVIFPKEANRLYELASLIRFNYGLNYEIIALTSELDGKIDVNEIKLHDISLIDHTYENKFGYDLNKSRSFCLGYDSMLISYAISNQIKGEIRGLLGTYTISTNSIEINSYIN
tara:strand:+ start:1181 stop:2254 length:1074 start_codon:yes stop_codon:yes gene_type:complete